VRSARLLDTLTLVFLVLTGLIAAWYAIIFVAPNFLNPFPPSANPQVIIVTPTLGTPTQTRPPTWTPSPTLGEATRRPSATPSRTGTRRPTRTPLPTDTPTPTQTPTPTEDVCASLALLGPPPGQKFFQYDVPALTWTFDRPLAPNEHFDLMLDPPGLGMSSIAWADEANTANKDCSDSPGYCVHEIGLNGVYSGGRFLWTVSIIRTDNNRRVLGTVCSTPDPFFFDW
jgi:hypothetical protein